MRQNSRLFIALPLLLVALLMLARSTTYVTDVHWLNLLRASLFAALNLALVASLTMLFWRGVRLCPYPNMIRALQVLVWILMAPVAAVACLIVVLFTPTFFPSEGLRTSEQKVGESTIYIEASGEETGHGEPASAVVLERPVGMSFRERRVLCSLEHRDGELRFRVLDPHTIECALGPKNEMVRIP